MKYSYNSNCECLSLRVGLSPLTEADAVVSQLCSLFLCSDKWGF